MLLFVYCLIPAVTGLPVLVTTPSCLFSVGELYAIYDSTRFCYYSLIVLGRGGNVKADRDLGRVDSLEMFGTISPMNTQSAYRIITILPVFLVEMSGGVV